MKMYGGWRWSPTRILNLGTRWWWMVSFMLRLLLPWGKSSWLHLNKRLDGLKFGLDVVERKSLPLPGNEPRLQWISWGIDSYRHYSIMLSLSPPLGVILLLLWFKVSRLKLIQSLRYSMEHPAWDSRKENYTPRCPGYWLFFRDSRDQATQHGEFIRCYISLLRYFIFTARLLVKHLNLRRAFGDLKKFSYNSTDTFGMKHQAKK
jgi:hypothetical protein